MVGGDGRYFMTEATDIIIKVNITVLIAKLHNRMLSVSVLLIGFIEFISGLECNATIRMGDLNK